MRLPCEAASHSWLYTVIISKRVHFQKQICGTVLRQTLPRGIRLISPGLCSNHRVLVFCAHYNMCNIKTVFNFQVSLAGSCTFPWNIL